MLLLLFVWHAAAREARREPGAAEQAAERRPLLSTLEPPRAVQCACSHSKHHLHKSHLAVCVAADHSFSQFPQALPPSQSLIHLLLFPSHPLSVGRSLPPLLDSALTTWWISLPDKRYLLLPLIVVPSYPIHCLYELLNYFSSRGLFLLK